MAFASVMAEVKEINSVKEFNDTIAHGATVAKFWGKGCPKCEGAQSSLKHASNEVPGVNFISVHALDFPELEQKYTLRGYPTFIYFKNGQEVKRHGDTGNLKATIVTNAQNINK